METINLTGSEKQVKWANDIIAIVIRDLETTMERARASQPTHNAEAFKAVAEAAISAHTEAKWWIDNNPKSIAGTMQLHYASNPAQYQLDLTAAGATR